MSDVVIRVEGLGKRYRIGQRQEYRTLKEALAGTFSAPFRRLSSYTKRLALKDEERRTTNHGWIWALKDVFFDVKNGEIIGIIGRNGAGKSTLLKILSRITKPTQGYAEVQGRVGSLLEVGTGFHPELTGRENIYLNGAILGMKKAEINRKFDEILAFAEIEKFIDTPVKRYSSGMYVRLAFAVAAHLETEILLVDEVLAVGDAAFQKKCLSKMEDVGYKGRTVLFISHSMPAVTRLCKRAILLDEGRIVTDGPAHQVASAYLNSGAKTRAERVWKSAEKTPSGEVARLYAVRVRSEEGQVIDAVDIRKAFRIEMEYEVLKPGYMLMPNFQFFNEENVAIFSAHDLDPDWRRRRRPKGQYVSTAWVPGNLLSEGIIFVGAALETIDPAIHQFYEHDAVAFQVIDGLEGNSARGDYAGHMTGTVRPLLKWTTKLYHDESKSCDCKWNDEYK